MRAVILAAVIGFGSVSPLQAESLVGAVRIVTIARGDTLRVLGSRLGVDPATIARDNGQSLEAPLQVGAELRVDNRHIIPSFPPDVTVLVNVPQRMVFAVSRNGVTAYPIAVGRASWPTPLGEFTITSKETNPTWDVPQSIREEAQRAGRPLPLRVPPGPGNPLGAYWLGLSVGSVGLHGTDAPTSVYQPVTHGCIRLQASNIEELFGLVQVGTRGELVYKPLLVLVSGDEVFLEVHRDIYRRGPRDPLAFVKTKAGELGVTDRVDWDAAARVIQERAGVARSIARRPAHSPSDRGES
jgi:L,D-transpeptidase ErfK/SrfK